MCWFGRIRSSWAALDQCHWLIRRRSVDLSSAPSPTLKVEGEAHQRVELALGERDGDESADSGLGDGEVAAEEFDGVGFGDGAELLARQDHLAVADGEPWSSAFLRCGARHERAVRQLSQAPQNGSVSGVEMQPSQATVTWRMPSP